MGPWEESTCQTKLPTSNYMNLVIIIIDQLSLVMRKPDFRTCENKGTDQLEADQRHCFRYSDSTIPLLLKSKISSF